MRFFVSDKDKKYLSSIIHIIIFDGCIKFEYRIQKEYHKLFFHPNIVQVSCVFYMHLLLHIMFPKNYHDFVDIRKKKLYHKTNAKRTQKNWLTHDGQPKKSSRKNHNFFIRSPFSDVPCLLRKFGYLDTGDKVSFIIFFCFIKVFMMYVNSCTRIIYWTNGRTNKP